MSSSHEENEKHDLSTPTGVQSYLASTKFASHTVTALTGGTGNFAFRLHLVEPYDGKKTLVAKHARPYVASRVEMAFDLKRQTFEVEALRQVKQHVVSSSSSAGGLSAATVPEVYHFDEEAHVIIMEDCGEGSMNLKALMMGANAPSVEVAREIGRALGEFLGRLHAWGAREENSKVLDTFFENAQGKAITSWITYGRLISTLTSTPPHPAVSLLPEFPVPESDLDDIRAIISERTEEIQTSRETLTMGDFWTGNVMVNLRANSSLDSVYVIDWELAKAGVAALDVGQFCAEMLCLDVFRKAKAGESARALIEEFLGAYRGSCGGMVEGHFANVAAKHVGAHLVAITPQVGWGPPEESVKAVELGLEYLMEGCSDRWVRERSILAPLM
ncbi:APH domain-containing protein [Favolaschia claudopus]|uniref:APH domain-containing protein n=1 Tax=Favolaschia claudopus TaxID=2862362 RepID=A0AAW0DIU1_9AGAR